MQSALREKYRSRSVSAPGSTASIEARVVFESALQHELSQQQNEQSQQESILVDGDLVASSNVSDACKELGQELVAVSTQMGEGNSRIQGIMTRMEAALDQNVDGISEPFFEAIESMVNQRMVDTFINVMTFCIKLVFRYRAASPSTPQDKAIWVTEQVYELMASAYQRYHIYEWIQEQGGWKAVLGLVREKHQTCSDYAPQGGRGFTRRNTALTVGAAFILGAVALGVWYNW